jgi:ABC-type lipoprotein export system ATPase subunit
MSDFSIVEAHGIRKEFPNMTAPVLDDVNLTIESGEIVALRGPSGSGKSTLLNIIGCLDGPTRGSYSLGGRDVSTLSARERAWVRLHYIGFIFQSFHLITDHTVIENVTLPLYYAGLGREEREARATELIERVGLGHRMNHRPDRCSRHEDRQ